jgi:hypothetical protein
MNGGLTFPLTFPATFGTPVSGSRERGFGSPLTSPLAATVPIERPREAIDPRVRRALYDKTLATVGATAAIGGVFDGVVGGGIGVGAGLAWSAWRWREWTLEPSQF